MGSDQIVRTCVLNDEMEKILEQFYSSSYGDHFSAVKISWKVLQSGFYLPTLFNDINTFVCKCNWCQHSCNISNHNEFPLNFILEVVIFYVWGIDFIEFSLFLNRYISRVINYVSKWLQVLALPTNDTWVVVSFLKKNISSHYSTS